MNNIFSNKITLLISGILTTILLTNLNTNLAWTAVVISAVIQLFLMFRTNFADKINKVSKNKLMSNVISLFAVSGFLITFLWRSNEPLSPMIFIVSIGTYPFVYKIYSFLINIIYEYKYAIKEYQNIFLYYSIWAIIIFILTIYIFNTTSALHYPVSIDGIRENNIIFGSDVADFSGYKNHFFVGDQLRHPALTIIMMPLLMFIYLISTCLTTMLNLDVWVLFSLLHSGMQAFVYSIIATMIFSLLKNYMSKLLSFCGGLFYLSTFSTILFSSMIERFSFEIAFLLLFVIMTYKKSNENHENMLFSIVTFSVISSAAIYPIKFLNRKLELKDILKTIRLGLCMLAGLFIMGRGTILFSFGNDMQHNLRYVVGSIFDNRLLQYLSFQSGIFTSPNWTTLYKSNYDFEFPASKYGEFADGIIMQAYPQQNIFYVIGAIILLFTVISFILNRRSLLAQICFYWFIFGVFLLGIVGLGSTYNEMALYLSYFSWSQIILIILFLNKVIKNEKAKLFILLTLTILLFIMNINTMIEMTNVLNINYPPLI